MCLECGVRGASVSKATSVDVFGICAKLSLMNCLISEVYIWRKNCEYAIFGLYPILNLI